MVLLGPLIGMFDGRRENPPGGEEIKHTEGAGTAQERVERAVESLAASYKARRDEVGESLANEAQVAMAAPTLIPQLQESRRQQLDALGVDWHKPNDIPPSPSQAFISDLILDVHVAYNAVKEIPEVAQVLCSYMLHPQTEELDCFFARELLQKDILIVGTCDSLMQDSATLAEHLTRLRKQGSALRTNLDDRNLLSEIERLTTPPKLWLAVLDNVLECEKMGTKAYLVVEELKKNLSTVENNPAVAKKLELLASSNKANLLKQLRGEDTSELALPPVAELDLGAGEIY